MSKRSLRARPEALKRNAKRKRRQSRLSRAGNRHLRSAPYLPALAAFRWEPRLRGFYQNLVSRGKRKKQALLAVARKLPHVIYGVFRNDRTCQGRLVFQRFAVGGRT
jgi:transposase